MKSQHAFLMKGASDGSHSVHIKYQEKVQDIHWTWHCDIKRIIDVSLCSVCHHKDDRSKTSHSALGSPRGQEQECKKWH